MLFLLILEYIVLHYNLVECQKKQKKEIIKEKNNIDLQTEIIIVK